MESLASLLNTLPQVGKVEWIGLRTAREGPISIVQSAQVVAGRGIEGDHRMSGRINSKRQITLIQAEHLVAVASMLQRDHVLPELVRRNVLVSGVNLLALKGKQFQVGAVTLEYTGPCEPCSRMEATFGPGGYNAMRGHGGITARILTSGVIQVGDPVRFQGVTNPDSK